MRKEGFSFIEIIVSLNILVLVLLPTANGIFRSLSKYKNYQKKEEEMDILNNLAVYLQMNEGLLNISEIKLQYVEEKEGYLYGEEFFSSIYLKEKELKFSLVLKNTSEEQLKFVRLTLEEAVEMKREFFILRREEP